MVKDLLSLRSRSVVRVREPEYLDARYTSTRTSAHVSDRNSSAVAKHALNFFFFLETEAEIEAKEDGRGLLV